MFPTITVDIGTTSVKLCHFDESGDLVGSAKHPTPTTADAFGEIYRTDTLERLVADFVKSLDEPFRRAVKRIAIAGVGESGGLVTPDISLASPMILWHDHRGADRLARFDDATRTTVYGITGLPLNANYGISKVAWASEQAGSNASGAQWLNISEFLAATLTGHRWSEFSLASRTMALDLAQKTWSEEMCELFGIDVALFPELHPATFGARVSPEQAAQLGLDTDVTVHVAGHDHMVGAAGADLVRGELLNSTGTTEGLLFLTEQPTLGSAAGKAKLANGISPSGTDYTLFASIPTGGSAFATLQSMLDYTADQVAEIIARMHRRYIAGEVDLGRVPLVVPQFRGSPPPTKDAAARGIIAGLRTDSTADDIVFGCFLGMTMQFSDVLDLLPVSADRVKVIGPASGNPLWQQLKADLLGTPLTASRFPEVVSRGAQAIASGTTLTWAQSDPDDVAPHADRHEALTEWTTSVRAQWNHLKGLPS